MMHGRQLWNMVFRIIFWIYVKNLADFVIENFVDEYLAGRTPNPCVLCNTHIKWRALLKRADALGCDFIATGHYAKIRQHDNGRYVVSKAIDDTKDQSYVLWGLQQDLLSRTLLPLAPYQKNRDQANGV